jgi:hypothetical protein
MDQKNKNQAALQPWEETSFDILNNYFLITRSCTKLFLPDGW